jgi:hypothetical protein
MIKVTRFILMLLIILTSNTGCKDKNKTGQQKSMVVGASMLSLQSEFVVNVSAVLKNRCSK